MDIGWTENFSRQHANSPNFSPELCGMKTTQGRHEYEPVRTNGPLSAFSADSTRQLDILGHDRDPLCVNGAQIGVLEKTNQVRLRRFLQGSDSRGLEPQIGLKILCDLPDETLEREFADKKLRRLLVPSDFSEGDGAWPVAMRFLDTSGRRSALPGSFGGQLLPGSLASSRLTGRLLCTSHYSS